MRPPHFPMQVFLCVLVIAAVICTQLWAVVSWFVQFKRMFAVCFLVSIVWNWFYLYKVTATPLLPYSHAVHPLSLPNGTSYVGYVCSSD